MKLVYIQWCDAIGKEAWDSLEEAKEWGRTDRWLVENVGWVLDETKEYILFATKKATDGDIDHYGGLFKVPKTWIRKRQAIKL